MLEGVWVLVTQFAATEFRSNRFATRTGRLTSLEKGQILTKHSTGTPLCPQQPVLVQLDNWSMVSNRCVLSFALQERWSDVTSRARGLLVTLKGTYADFPLLSERLSDWAD